MRDAKLEFSALFLIFAGIGSVFMTAFGLFNAAWGGFWDGSILHLLFWSLPTISVLIFGGYFLSRRFGLFCSWAISIGSALVILIMNLQSCLAGNCTTRNPAKIGLSLFYLPHIWILLIISVCLSLAGKWRMVSLNRIEDQLKVI